MVVRTETKKLAVQNIQCQLKHPPRETGTSICTFQCKELPFHKKSVIDTKSWAWVKCPVHEVLSICLQVGFCCASQQGSLHALHPLACHCCHRLLYCSMCSLSFSCGPTHAVPSDTTCRLNVVFTSPGRLVRSAYCYSANHDLHLCDCLLLWLMHWQESVMTLPMPWRQNEWPRSGSTHKRVKNSGMMSSQNSTQVGGCW